MSRYLLLFPLVFTLQSLILPDALARNESHNNAAAQVQYKPSGLIERIDFEHEKIKPMKGKRGSYDKMVFKNKAGKTASVGIMYEGGTSSDRYAKIIPDPTTDSNNHVLKYWLKHARVPDQKKGKFKGRIQMNLANVNKTSIFERFRLYLHPDLKYYREYPKLNTWFTINEMWMGARWKKHPYPFRMGLKIAKPKGVNQPLYFVIGASVSNGGKLRKGKWKDVWHEVGTNFEVPVGEWLDMEIGYRQGDNKTGRYYLAVKREKDTKYTTIFDVTNWTYHPDSPKPVPLTDWQPLKIYTSSRIVDFIRKKGGAVQMYWDDLEIYDDWK